MNPTRLLMIATCIVCFSSCLRMPVQQTTQQLIDMELQRSKAIAAHDTVTLDKMYASDFKGVTAIGSEVDKQTLMQVFKRDNPSVVFTNDQHKVQLINKTTAILTGKLTGKEPSGKIAHQSVYMHVLVWRDKRWQIVRGQGTMVVER